VVQERTGLPSTSTVHAPHLASPQPYLLPVRSSSSRRTPSRLRPPSASTFWRTPLTWSSTSLAIAALPLVTADRSLTPSVVVFHPARGRPTRPWGRLPA